MDINELKKQLINKNKTIVFPEGNDIRILKAAKLLQEENIAKVILLGNEIEIFKLCEENNIKHNDFKIIDITKSNNYEEYLNTLYELRKGKNSLEECKDMLSNENYFAVLMLKCGHADAVLCGARYSTADTVRPALQILKTKKDFRIISSCFLLLKENEKPIIFADCAINVNPNSQDLCDIAIQSAKSARVFGIEPKVGFLSFSTKGSAKDDSIEQINLAIKQLKDKDVDFEFDGEFQFDTAFNKEVALQKAPNSKIAGDVNVFIFPNLNSGNIGYKIAQRLGGYQALGPILQGVSKPINDLSRGCNVSDIYKMAIITLLQE